MKTKHLKAAGTAVSLFIASGPALAMCIDGTTAQCTVNGHPGTRECVNGRWTSCTADPTPDPSCARQAKATLDASPSMLALGQSATLNWSVTLPPKCTGGSLTLNNEPVKAQDSMTVQPAHDQSYVLTFEGVQLANLAIKVNLPIVDGRPTVTITSDHQVGLFLQAGTPNAVVRIQNHVNLDLSYRDDLHIAAGVHIIGGRSSTEPGPRLFTTTATRRLFVIGWDSDADGVRISGLRLQGNRMDISDSDSDVGEGIFSDSNVNVEIDNNEIFGWPGSGVAVADFRRRICRSNGHWAVRVHDNYIHHNRHHGTAGYGVVLYGGSYAMIEKNVFDHNRHHIAADSGDGTGYFAYRNLALGGGRTTPATRTPTRASSICTAGTTARVLAHRLRAGRRVHGCSLQHVRVRSCGFSRAWGSIDGCGGRPQCLQGQQCRRRGEAEPRQQHQKVGQHVWPERHGRGRQV